MVEENQQENTDLNSSGWCWQADVMIPQLFWCLTSSQIF